MRNKAILFWLAVMFLFAGAISILYAAGVIGRNPDVVVVNQGHEAESSEVTATAESSVGYQIADFTLTDQLGRTFQASDMKGKIWIASVFFSTCPGFCPQQNQQLQRFQDEFGELGVECVSITCDPKVDTPPVLASYASRFNADPERWHFLTGDMEVIQRVGLDIFKIELAEDRHSQRFFVIDREGKIHDSFLSNDALAMAKMRKSLHNLLAESPESEASVAADQEAL